ncbi:MAG: phosphoglucosamine mutase [Actinomycetaceae bacterium]|nr:phosphoglucosamine mutase [Actinomycetaceae bacterium]
MGRLFGTDGVRGLAGKELTASLALELGEAAARVLTTNRRPGTRPKAIIGRDTRVSGELLGDAVAAGLASAGVDVQHVSIIPTPGIAYLTQSLNVDLGVVISASHNPMPDNGIKFFARGGHKLDDALEEKIEKILGTSWDRPTGASVGRVGYSGDSADSSYIRHLSRSIDTSLQGLRIGLDCANGATSIVAPEAFTQAGADVHVINAQPDGYNINDNCGSTHPEQLQKYVVENKLDCGFAFDGDADRCLAVDHEGNLIDGDYIMGILALSMHQRGRLAHDTLVVTVMSNLGLLLAMKEHNISTVQASVGDRYVLENMLHGGFTLGGEQSGHIINLNHATTGDGTLTGLTLAAEIARSGKSLQELSQFMRKLPQTLVNVGGVDKTRVDSSSPLQEAIKEVEKELDGKGRVLLRPSGTEPLVRVMVEAPTQELADKSAELLASIVKDELSL